MKNIILGKKSWDSLTLSFQKEITVDADQFTKEEEYDGVLLWDYFRRTIRPSTTMGASEFKTLIKTKTLANFDQDMIKYNKFLKDTKTTIISKEGEGGYK